MPRPFLWSALQLIQTPDGGHVHLGALLPGMLGLGSPPITGLIAAAGEGSGMPTARECQPREMQGAIAMRLLTPV